MMDQEAAFMFSNFAAIDLAAMPSLAAGEVRAHRVKLDRKSVV